jgi:hypothetical protein
MRKFSRIILFLLFTFQTSTAQCGKAKWDIKTGSDWEGQNPSEAHWTISDLVKLPKPDNSRERHQDTVEGSLLILDAELVEYKREPDGDYHLILTDGSHFLVAEIPNPDCAKGSRFHDAIAQARVAFESTDYDLQPSTRFKTTHIAVSIEGLGFFDKSHGAKSAAPNGLEIHPVTAFQFRDLPQHPEDSSTDEDDDDDSGSDQTLLKSEGYPRVPLVDAHFLLASVPVSPAWPQAQPKPAPSPTPTTQATAPATTSGACAADYYRNSSGVCVHRPVKTQNSPVPAGAAAQCRDGSYSFSQHRSGTCSHHGGVAKWL